MPEITQDTFDALKEWMERDGRAADMAKRDLREALAADPAFRKPFHEALQEELGEEEWEINPSKIEDEVLVFCKNRPEWPHPWLRLSAQDDPKKVADALRVLAGEDEG
jgi:hypothetical protein